MSHPSTLENTLIWSKKHHQSFQVKVVLAEMQGGKVGMQIFLTLDIISNLTAIFYF